MNLTDIDQIRELLYRHGFHFSKAKGQNFLTAAWVPEDIAESAMLGDDVGVLEIGPGVGCLTRELSSRAKKVVSVELDKALKPILSKTLSDCDNVEVIYGDILRQDIPALCREKLEGLRPVVCANLPYNVTSPLLTALIKADCFEYITVMIQREVALRLCAKAGTSDYGAFGLFVQWHTEPEILFDVPASCFIPQPKVSSSVIRLKKRSAPPVSVRDELLLFRLIRACFNQRRKTLVNAMCAGIDGLERAQAERAVVNSGFDARIRGEAIDIGGFAKISDELSGIIPVDL